MKITNTGLLAFFTAANLQNMTLASEKLGLTQSALSQRIMKLEDELETTLFIRDGKKIKLTEAGSKLFQFCLHQNALEEELLETLLSNKNELAGTIRIAAFSSILRSKIIPTLAPFLKKNPKVDISFRSYEMVDLPAKLNSGEADLIILDYQLNKTGIVEKKLFIEKYVVIQSKKNKIQSDIYLDHSPEDNATELFFSNQKNAPKNYRRAFMGDVYGIIDGVKAGLGRAVMSEHLIENEKDIEIIKNFQKLERPVTLHYFERPYYSRLFTEVIKHLNFP